MHNRTLTHILKLFSRPPLGENSRYKHVDPRPGGKQKADDARNFTLMPTNLRTVHQLCRHPAALPHLASEAPSLKAIGESGSFELALLALLACHL